MRALVLIDIQEGMDSPLWGARNNPDAETNAARLLARFRETGAPIAHVHHVSKRPASPLHPDNGGTAIKAIVTPRGDEPVFSKSTNSAFIGTDLERHLRDSGVTGLVIAGLSTPQCISTSMRMGANLGFDVWLAHDACAAFETHAITTWRDGLPPLSAQQIHDTEVSMLHGEFGQALSTDAILKAYP
ncbi:cysteine hydrolase family protein [Shimia abyssi]|uniref:Nicotinamidase-related amidase n=1 Tax=Shimia abyssi TaxID=1662395 RepID=A0A2P8FGQ5_9RHOB|nr:cysteine hydrolase family protein [Shimia abyssi]PSL20916.1 nicotinamidase-related amidase [Shimia abyssi]